MYRSLLVLLLFPAPLWSQLPDIPVRWVFPAAERLTETEVLQLCLEDILTQTTPERFRYVWIPDGNPSDQAVVSFVLNAVVSRSRENYAPGVPGSPIQYLHSGQIVRVDLFRLSRSDRDEFREVSRIWDSLRNPVFLTERTGKLPGRFQTLRKTSLRSGNQVLRELPAGTVLESLGTSQDGKWLLTAADGKSGYVLRSDLRETEILTWGAHVDAAVGSALQAHTGAFNPVIPAMYLYVEALTQADGGKYYEFMDIPGGTEDDLSALLRKLGVDDRDLFRQGQIQRATISVSQVTGKPRAVDHYTRSSRPEVNQGLISVTMDPLDGPLPADKDPWTNLLQFEIGGMELIFERDNGHLGYALYDGNRKRVDEAPQNLVSDHEIPRPYSRRLQPAISCIRCHGASPADDGWKPITPEMPRLLNRSLEAVDDRTGEKLGLDADQTRQHIRDLHGLPLLKTLQRARLDHTQSVAVSVIPANPLGKVWQFEQVADHLRHCWVRHFYTPVTAEIACRELGLTVPQNRTPESVLAERVGLTPDPRLAKLIQGMPLTRAQWEEIYEDAAIGTSP